MLTARGTRKAVAGSVKSAYRPGQSAAGEAGRTGGAYLHLRPERRRGNLKARISSPGVAWRCLLVLCLWLVAGQAPAADPFAVGVAAFKQGDYDRALGLFLEARREGRDSEALRYNLAATYYRLGRYEDSARYFRSLLPTKPALASYNLGLVARAQGDSETAARRFAQSLRAAEPDSRLASLASQALERVRSEAAPGGDASGGAQLAVGYDDNVAFEPVGGRNDLEDAFVEGYFWGRYAWPVTDRDRLSLSAGLYTLRFSDYGRYDLLDLTARAAWRRDLGELWQLDLEARAGRLWQEGTPALDSTGGQVTVSRELGEDWRLGAGYAGTQYAATEDYAYLDGARHEISVNADYAAGDWWWRVRYARRWDDRRDSEYNGSFASYSPRSHRLSVRARYEIGADWSVDGEVDWNTLEYADPDVFESGGGTVSRTRADEYRGLSLRLQRYLGESWRVYVEYRHDDNDSNIDSYEYSRNVALLGVAWRLP